MTLHPAPHFDDTVRSPEHQAAVELARESVASLLGAEEPAEILFTQSGTESNRCALVEAVELRPNRTHIITTAVEHEAVRNVVNRLEASGCRVSRLDVDGDGSLDLNHLRSALCPGTGIVSIMHANNETGIIFPIDEVADLVKEVSDAVVHVDGGNAAGKIPVNLSESQIDLYSISAHKFHGPKGIGALYVRKGLSLVPILTDGAALGASAEGELLRKIVGLGAAAEFAKDLSKLEPARTLRDHLEDKILKKIPNSRLNGARSSESRLPNTSNISFENTNGEAILSRLEEIGVRVSTGSACASVDQRVSPVLQAMGVPYSYAMGSIRFSLSRYSTSEEIEKVLSVLPEIVQELRNLSAG